MVAPVLEDDFGSGSEVGVVARLDGLLRVPVTGLTVDGGTVALAFTFDIISRTDTLGASADPVPVVG